MASARKHEKTAAKLEKKRAKAEVKRQKQPGSPSPGEPRKPSPAVRYAEAVRGILYVLTGLSFFVALILGQRGAVVSLDDLIDGLFLARAGKVVIALIGAALLIYGLKHLRVVR